jgi:AcrR family transcriptional regulator
VPKIVDRMERRTSIAAAAAEAIAEEGIEAVTMNAIAARAGVTTGAVTHYFADKDEVVMQALLLVDASMQLRFESALAKDSSLVDALLAALPHDAESRRDWNVWRVFSDRASRSTSLRSQYRASSGAWLDAAVETLAARRGCPAGAVMLDAEVVVSTVDAIGDAAGVDPRSWPASRQRQVIEHLLSALDVS